MENKQLIQQTENQHTSKDNLGRLEYENGQLKKEKRIYGWIIVVMALLMAAMWFHFVYGWQPPNYCPPADSECSLGL